DADPAGLMVSSVAPSEIREGQGDFGSRPAILVITGANFIEGAHVELTASGAVSIDVDNANLKISGDAHMLAVPVTAHVDPNLHDGTNISLAVKVTQMAPAGPVSAMLDSSQSGLVLRGLDELTAAPKTGQNDDWSKLKPLYSQVTLTGTQDLNAGTRGTRVIVAVSSITVDKLTAQGSVGNAT